MQHSFIVSVEVISAYSLQLTQKSLTKTKSLLTQKSSMQHSFTTDAEIVSVYGLQLTQKSLTKTESLPT
jgi:hypothetical protein